ncbi:MAG: 4-hydroxy-tetrahydrodipicolinate reductase [Candidatus Omnitrophica bacterium]|nr:4-hydroxy-tetrahydrodipicolinate reductase [Candidatus Omnitrophota bacterium]
MVKIGVIGAAGRMGRKITGIIVKDPQSELAAAIERQDCPELGNDMGTLTGAGELGVKVSSDLAGACSRVDCFIDFTLPAPTLEHIPVCVEKGVPMVIGTTGIDEAGKKAISDAAKSIPIVFSPNMSLGVNVLFKIVHEAAKALGPDFSIKIDETHHVHKKDSPSGTAKMIGEVIEKAAGSYPPVEAFREGEVIGNHGIVFESEYETLEIRHDAKAREVFAAGSVKAAKFVAGKAPGLYDMGDVLGLK